MKNDNDKKNKVEQNYIDRKLESYLTERGLVSRSNLEAAKAEMSINHNSLGDILISNLFVKQDVVLDAMLSINPEHLVAEQKIIQHIPYTVLEEYRFKIAADTPKAVYVSTLSDEDVVENVLKSYFPEQNIVFIPADPESIEEYIARVSTIQNSQSSELENTLRDAIYQGASDIHILSKRDIYTVMYRVDGISEIVKAGTKEDYLKISNMIKDRGGMDMMEKSRPQDGGFDINFNGRTVSLRIASIPLDGSNETIIIRILDPKNSQIELEELGITRIDEWHKGSSRSHGLNLICGETGSGKTTTITSTARAVDRISQVVYTTEDPVEHRTPYFRQININADIGLTFARALKAILRADPNIIIIGEIRDPETAKIAIQAAETGHLIFATLHTGSILDAVGRLVDLEVPLYKLRSVLRSVLVQHLMRKLCPHCKNEVGVRENCSHCRGRGYKGRSVISECKYFRNEAEVRETFDVMEPTWPTILEDAFLKVKTGVSDVDELHRIFGPEAVDIINERKNELLELNIRHELEV